MQLCNAAARVPRGRDAALGRCRGTVHGSSRSEPMTTASHEAQPPTPSSTAGARHRNAQHNSAPNPIRCSTAKRRDVRCQAPSRRRASRPQLGRQAAPGYVDRNVSTASTTATLAQIRRTIVGAQGFAGRYRRADETRRRGGDPPALGGAARLDLDRRPRAPADALLAHRRVRPGSTCRSSSAPGGSSSTGRTRRRCCRSSSGRTSAPRWRAAATGAGTTARSATTPSCSSRCSSGSAPKGRSARATSRGAAAAATCGTGSRRRWCSRRCGTAGGS